MPKFSAGPLHQLFDGRSTASGLVEEGCIPAGGYP